MMPKIMLVDDIDISNFLLKRQLAKIMLQLEVFDFVDPTKAFESIAQISPDIIFLDLNMPTLSGWEFLEKMQSKNINNKVIILTSSISILDKQRSKNYNNVIGFYEKPITRDMLTRCLQSSLTQDFLLL